MSLTICPALGPRLGNGGVDKGGSGDGDGVGSGGSDGGW